MSAIVSGVDGGGSRTRVLVADEQGREIVSVEGEGSAVRRDSSGRRTVWSQGAPFKGH